MSYTVGRGTSAFITCMKAVVAYASGVNGATTICSMWYAVCSMQYAYCILQYAMKIVTCFLKMYIWQISQIHQNHI